MNPSREDIRAFACPECGARASQPCVYAGKRATIRMAQGRNHHLRMQVAQRALNIRSDTQESLIDDGDIRDAA